MSEIRYVQVGSGKSIHAATALQGEIQTPQTLCKREWTTTYTHTGPTFAVTCKSCLKIWDANRLSERPEVANESTRKIAVEIEVQAPDQAVSDIIDLLDSNPWDESAPRQTYVGKFVIMNETEYRVVDQTPDQVVGGGEGNDWLVLQATDRSGRNWIQVKDVADMGGFSDTPRPAPASVVPAPRKPFTPADMDAINIRRRVGSKVRVNGDSGTGRVARVLPRLGENPPSVVVRWSDGHTSRYALADVMLTAN